MWSRRKLDAVLSEAHRAIKELNDRYTDPSGRRSATVSEERPGASAATDAEAGREESAGRAWGRFRRPAAERQSGEERRTAG